MGTTVVDVLKRGRDRKLQLNARYGEVTGLCEGRIMEASRAPGVTSIRYRIPLMLHGIVIPQVEDCALYVKATLEKNGFVVQGPHQDAERRTYIIVSWNVDDLEAEQQRRHPPPHPTPPPPPEKARPRFVLDFA
jgi:tRNA nucleotidyltransferase (CCA-adding enzyme)